MSLISASRCSAAARPRVSAVALLRVDVAKHAVEQQRRIADQRIDRRAQLVRHAGEKLRFELVRALDFLRLPLQSRVLLREVGGRLADALLELAVQLLERLVKPLVLDLLGEIVQHRDDRDRLAAFVLHLSRHDFDRRARGPCADGRATCARGASRSSSSANSEMNDVNFVSLPRTAASSRRVRDSAFADLKELLGLVVHQDDVRPFVGDENRIGDVLEDQVEPVALAAHA